MKANEEHLGTGLKIWVISLIVVVVGGSLLILHQKMFYPLSHFQGPAPQVRTYQLSLQNCGLNYTIVSARLNGITTVVHSDENDWWIGYDKFSFTVGNVMYSVDVRK